MTLPAMIFAAGRGTRMGVLTNTCPKPLLSVADRPLLDRALDLLRDAGCAPIVINTHYLGDMIARHLRAIDAPDVLISVENPVLETGGGLRAALSLLGSGPVITINPDVVWIGPNPIEAMLRAWRDEMHSLLLTIPEDRTTGRRGPGDFSIEDGKLRRGGSMVYGGCQIVRPDRLNEIPEQVFSVNKLWDLHISDGTAYGAVYPGHWCDVGRPEGIASAEARLAAS